MAEPETPAETPMDATVETESRTVAHDVDVNPCQHDGSRRTVMEYSWRDPAFWVECQGCGNAQAASTLDEAVDAWNAANPARDISADEAHEADLVRVKALVTPDFLHALDMLTDVHAASGTQQSFEGWCHDMAEG